MTKEEISEYLVGKLTERFLNHKDADNLIDITFLNKKNLILKFSQRPAYIAIQSQWDREMMNLRNNK